MTENELKTFIRTHFPRENENCEWKEFKNLKNSFNGEEKEDVISYVSAFANMNGGYLILGVVDKSLDIVGIRNFSGYTVENVPLRLCEQCTNLPTEGLEIDSYTTSDTHKTVWIIKIPKHSPRLPVYAHRKAWQRVGDSLVAMNDSRREAILSEISMDSDWTKEIVEGASLADLDPEAIEKARKEFKRRNPKYAAEMDTWDDAKFLNKAKLTIKGKITRAALILLGKEESEHFINPGIIKIRWSLKSKTGENKDYEVFSMPMILAVDALLAKIRNVKYISVRPDSLFPDEMMRYDIFSIREPLHNCIAHQDYTKGARIEVVEFEDDRLIFQNAGNFIPESLEAVLTNDCPESVYRNPFLVEAMRNLNMIETQGGGILKLFNQQKKRLFPLPEYDLSNNRVKVEISGNVLDENFANILLHNADLSLREIMLLDKVQKRKPLSPDEIHYLRSKKWIEGRKPNVYLSADIARISSDTNLRKDYIHNRSFDDQHFKDLIVEYLKKFPRSTKADIFKLLKDKLSEVLTEAQKQAKVRNLMQALRRDGQIRVVEKRKWEAK